MKYLFNSPTFFLLKIALFTCLSNFKSLWHHIHIDIIMPQVEDAKFNFSKKKILPYRKNYSCKDYLLFVIIPFHQVFLLSQSFSGMFFS